MVQQKKQTREGERDKLEESQESWIAVPVKQPLFRTRMYSTSAMVLGHSEAEMKASSMGLILSCFCLFLILQARPIAEIRRAVDRKYLPGFDESDRRKFRRDQSGGRGKKKREHEVCFV